MLSSQLSRLKEILKKSELERVEQYVDSLTLNSKITISKFATNTDINTDLAMKVLDMLSAMDILSLKFGIRCPECGFLIELVDSFVDIDSTVECYSCESEGDITSDNIEVI